MIRFLQLDVFTERAGGGNPLGVVLGADTWDGARMQRLAAWLGLVETTFVLPPQAEGASYKLRIFTPQREIPFAGHPTIGSAHAVLDTKFAAPRHGALLQECGAGLLTIAVDGAGDARRLFVESPRATVLRGAPDAEPALDAALANVPRGALAPAFVEGGRRWWVAELADEATLRGWRPNHAAIGALARASDSLGLCVFARAADGGAAIAVRAFPAGVGIVEDPASGAANGLIAAYLAQSEPDGPRARGYRVSQGREIGHDAVIDVWIRDGGAIWVGGKTQTVIDGSLRFE